MPPEREPTLCRPCKDFPAIADALRGGMKGDAEAAPVHAHTLPAAPPD